MTRVFESTIVAAPIDRVWHVIGDFDGLHRWSPRIVSSRLEGGTGRGAVGSVRRLERDDGLLIAERLLAYDSVARTLTYCFDGEAPFAARDYRGTVAAQPITDTDSTFVSWSCTFDAEADDEENLVAAFRHVFRSGLDHLARSVKPG
jgi:hypothetical protein